MPVADVEGAIAEQERKRDVDKAATQQAEPQAKQRRDRTDEARERQTDLQAKEKDGAMPSDKTTVPAKQISREGRTHRGKSLRLHVPILQRGKFKQHENRANKP